MSTDATQNEIMYRPHLAGRIARVVIPVLHMLLPSAWYRATYDALYAGFKKALRFKCLLRVLGARLFGDEKAVRRARLTYQLFPYTMGGHLVLENAFDLMSRVDDAEIPGALVECGVAEGGTSAMMALANLESGAARRQKWLFDSFEGLPEPTEEDYEGGKTGDFIRPLPKGACLGTVEQVSRLMFEELGLDRSEVHLVKGWFQDTVPAHADKVGPIAVLRLDGDWYESTKIPLDHFYGLVSPGGFVIVDDYATCFGSRRATDEFRQSRNISTPLNSDGRGGAWFEKPMG